MTFNKKQKMYSYALCMILSAGAVHSQSLVEPGTCELIVASRQSLSDARAYVRANIQDTRFTKIFKSNNGWYAISIGSLRPHEEQTVINNWKASGRIPQDSLCSRGGNYVAEYNWQTGNVVATRNSSNNRNRTASSNQSRTPSQGNRSQDLDITAGEALGAVMGLFFGGLGALAEASGSNSSSNRQCGIDWINDQHPSNTSTYRTFEGGCNGGAFAGNWVSSGTYTVTGPGGRSAFGPDRTDVIMRACGCY